MPTNDLIYTLVFVLSFMWGAGCVPANYVYERWYLTPFWPLHLFWKLTVETPVLFLLSLLDW